MRGVLLDANIIGCDKKTRDACEMCFYKRELNLMVKPTIFRKRQTHFFDYRIYNYTEAMVKLRASQEKEN